jgi:hypothetical protein
VPRAGVVNARRPGHWPAIIVPAQTAHDLVKALADLLLASAGEAVSDEERDDARQDHR